jgi:hypothetical protein
MAKSEPLVRLGAVGLSRRNSSVLYGERRQLEEQAIADFAGDEVPFGRRAAIRRYLAARACEMRCHVALENHKRGKVTLTVEQLEKVEILLARSLERQAKELREQGLNAKPPDLNPMEAFWRQPINAPEPPTPTHTAAADATTNYETVNDLANEADAPGASISDSPGPAHGIAGTVDEHESGAPALGEEGGEVGSGQFDD